MGENRRPPVAAAITDVVAVGMRVGSAGQPIDEHRIVKRVVGANVHERPGPPPRKRRHRRRQRVEFSRRDDLHVRGDHRPHRFQEIVAHQHHDGIQTLAVGRAPHNPLQDRLAPQLPADPPFGPAFAADLDDSQRIEHVIPEIPF